MFTKRAAEGKHDGDSGNHRVTLLLYAGGRRRLDGGRSDSL